MSIVKITTIECGEAFEEVKKLVQLKVDIQHLQCWNLGELWGNHRSY
jgi:hypothetical protein